MAGPRRGGAVRGGDVVGVCEAVSKEVEVSTNDDSRLRRQRTP